mmetsp:Transcript_103347/g.287724  ORF Transcript_103347/g.287724 Transcript_103347/m.287724 type:complete len:545 (+) Transcript_103347:119-1753(+)
MGKNQHSKDLLHLRPTEWAQDGRGFKERTKSPYAKLPLHCCFLSFEPFENPVGTRDGAVFDVANIIAYIKRFGVSPVTGGKLEVSDLVPLHFHRNSEGKLHCPVTFKVFTNHSHVVANMASGHVYSFDAVDQLNKKNKNWTDLITSKPFKWSDIVKIQDPDNISARETDKFYFMQSGQQHEVVRTITHRESEVSKESKKETLRQNAALERIFDEKRQIAAEKAQQEAEKEPAEAEAPADAEPQRPRKVNERYTSGEVAESFTSTSTPLRTQNDLRLQTEEEELQDVYDLVRKKKQKGYVRIITSEGMLNLELHTDIVPRTTDNFLRLCEKEFYDNTPFHRLIRNFMIQGGDPTGTGKGGQSAFQGGHAFKDEFDSRLVHQGPGVVSMANNGKNTNRSQFFISLKSCQHLDNRHSVFGRVVGGLKLLEVFNNWETDDKDKPKKEIKLIRTEVFKNPFKEAAAEAEKPKVEKVIDPVATWFSNRRDPMEDHKNRHSSVVGKYLDTPMRPLPGARPEPQELPAEEVEYASVVPKAKKARTAFDFTKW